MATDASRILTAIDRGDPQAAEQLLPLVYDELRKLAANRIKRERPGHSLQATGLVHEAYLRLLGPDAGAAQFADRGHFFAAAAQAMRRILIERARQRGTKKRGGDMRRLDLDPDALLLDQVPPEFLDLDEALAKLAEETPIVAQLVNLRFFGGLTIQQAAAALGISVATANRHQAYARAWLFDAMSDPDEK